MKKIKNKRQNKQSMRPSHSKHYSHAFLCMCMACAILSLVLLISNTVGGARPNWMKMWSSLGRQMLLKHGKLSKVSRNRLLKHEFLRDSKNNSNVCFIYLFKKKHVQNSSTTIRGKMGTTETIVRRKPGSKQAWFPGPWCWPFPASLLLPLPFSLSLSLTRTLFLVGKSSKISNQSRDYLPVNVCFFRIILENGSKFRKNEIPVTTESVGGGTELFDISRLYKEVFAMQCSEGRRRTFQRWCLEQGNRIV